VPLGNETETDKNVTASTLLDIVNDITVVETSIRESDTLRTIADMAKTPYPCSTSRAIYQQGYGPWSAWCRWLR
jgi:hypothetical protein